VVGVAVKVGKDVKHIKVGERCGLGAQASSCHRSDCEECSTGQENMCTRSVNAYASKYPDDQGGGKSYGGYSDYVRAPGHFLFKIPDGLSSAEAAPMLCGGVTTWSPLVQNGAGPGVRVGIVGVGGLGHFGLLWAKALGCEEVVAISRTSAKKADAEKMGVTNFIATDEDKDWAKKNSRTLDLIISTVSSPKMPIAKYLQLLRTNGQFIQVGAPEEALPGFNIFALIAKGAKIGGSAIGSPQEIRDMLEFAAKNKVHPWIKERPMTDANKAVVDMEDGHARYRYVLVNEKNVAEMEQK
jgi:alcohol dehydrogenase (NADP+)